MPGINSKEVTYLHGRRPNGADRRRRHLCTQSIRELGGGAQVYNRHRRHRTGATTQSLPPIQMQRAQRPFHIFFLLQVPTREKPDTLRAARGWRVIVWIRW